MGLLHTAQMFTILAQILTTVWKINIIICILLKWKYRFEETCPKTAQPRSEIRIRTHNRLIPKSLLSIPNCFQILTKSSCGPSSLVHLLPKTHQLQIVQRASPTPALHKGSDTGRPFTSQFKQKPPLRGQALKPSIDTLSCWGGCLPTN